MTAPTPAPLDFESLGLPSPLLARLSTMGFETPTEIQQRTIPPLLSGRDVVGQSQTGTGKTAAFALPLLSQIDTSSRATQVLVLTPTRELAIQVSEACCDLGKKLKGLSVLPIFGGQDYGVQIRGLKKGAHMVVGTPGRVMDHIRKGTLELSTLFAVVLDEADEMLRMGFIDDVQWIMDQTPDARQVALFSATWPPVIRKIAKTYLKNPVEVAIKNRSAAAETIDQRYCVVENRHKPEVLARILESEKSDGVIVFVRTKADTVTLTETLMNRGFRAAALNGDMAQNLREQTVDRLRKGRLNILVATDVAARGLDVERLSHVINYDAPRDAESYVHRIGRTGRAGRKGTAILLLSCRDRRTLNNLADKTRQPIAPMDIPSVSVLNQGRMTRFADDIGDALQDKSSKTYRDIVGKILDANPSISSFDMAVALAAMLSKESPLLLEPLPEQKPIEKIPNRANKLSDFKDRGRAKTPRPGDENMERYTVQVGATHGLNPSHLVGAIANEADLSSKFIGRIEIFKEHSTVDLPKGMPDQTFRLLKKVVVCNRPLKIRKAIIGVRSAKVAPPTRRRPKRSRRTAQHEQSPSL